MSIFSTEGTFYKFLTRFWDMVKLNFLWILFSLPVFTFGAATTAAFTVTLKMVDEEEGYVARQFVKAFKANFKQGTIMGLLNLVAIYALFIDYQLTDSLVFLVVFVLSSFLFFSIFIYAYALLARYDNTIPKTMKNSVKITSKYFGKTLMLLAVLFVEVLVLSLTTITLIIGLLIGPALIILTISGFAMSFFRQIELTPGSVIKEKTEEDLYNEEIERETEEALKRENIH